MPLIYNIKFDVMLSQLQTSTHNLSILTTSGDVLLFLISFQYIAPILWHNYCIYVVVDQINTYILLNLFFCSLLDLNTFVFNFRIVTAISSTIILLIRNIVPIYLGRWVYMSKFMNEDYYYACNLVVFSFGYWA